ncbi:exosortase system-associated protein, TIGR04073 family [bacterium]|nr:exosortase system-associated protein, TIGR04073 family [bacterium]
MNPFKRHRAGRFATFALGLVFSLALMVPASAVGPLYGSTYPSKITSKLGRGIGNLLFCWVEIPIEVNEEIQNTDPVTGTVVGIGEGLFYTVQRLGLSVVDIITFPIDVYGNNYQSIQRTEFPFIDEVE